MAPPKAYKLPNPQILNPKPSIAVYISILYNILLGIRLRISEDFRYLYKALGGIHNLRISLVINVVVISKVKRKL